MCPKIEINAMDENKGTQVDGEQLWLGWDSGQERSSLELRAGEGGVRAGLRKGGSGRRKEPVRVSMEGPA